MPTLSLIRYGLRKDIQPGYVAVSTQHPVLKRLMHGTPYTGVWHRHLRYLPGAMARIAAVRFGPVHSRVTLVPVELVGQATPAVQAAA